MMAEQLAAADRAAFTVFQVLRPAGDPRLSVFVELNRCAVVGRRASAAGFAKHFDRCPEQLGSEDIRSYHQKASWSRFNQVVCAFKWSGPCAFLAAQLGDTVLAAQPGNHDADLFFHRVLPPGRPSNIANGLLCRL